MLAFVKDGDAHPLLLQILDSQGITYRMALFPSEPGIDVLVVTPLNRSAWPASSSGFRQVFGPC